MLKNSKALGEEVLNQINGGEVKGSAIDYIGTSVHMARDQMMLKLDQVKAMIVDSYHSNPYEYSTTGSEEDLQEYLRLYEEAWNR